MRDISDDDADRVFLDEFERIFRIKERLDGKGPGTHVLQVFGKDVREVLLIVHHHHKIGLVEHRLIPLPESGKDYI
jgi:hypothetical protein